jgi:hypothetical protein
MIQDKKNEFKNIIYTGNDKKGFFFVTKRIKEVKKGLRK